MATLENDQIKSESPLDKILHVADFSALENYVANGSQAFENQLVFVIASGRYYRVQGDSVVSVTFSDDLYLGGEVDFNYAPSFDMSAVRSPVDLNR